MEEIQPKKSKELNVHTKGRKLSGSTEISLEKEATKVVLSESDSKIIEITKEDKATVHTGQSDQAPEINSSSPQVFHLRSRSHPGRTQICVIDLQLQEIQLIPIVKDNTQFAKKIIKRPLLIPEILKKRICLLKIEMRPYFDEKFIFVILDRLASPAQYYFFSIDLKKIESDQFGYKFISKRQVSRLTFDYFQDIFQIRPYRVSSRNLCLIGSKESQIKRTATQRGEKRHVNLIGQIIEPSSLPEIVISDEHSRPQRTFRLVFFLDVDPRKDNFYQIGRDLSKDPRIDLTKANLARILESPPIPTIGTHNQYSNTGRRNQKIVTFVEELRNLDLVLIVYDLSNRKILKKSYLFFKEILSGLGLVSRLWIYTASIDKYVLNPFKNSLHFSLSINSQNFDPTSEEDIAERQRLIDLGYDVSDLIEEEESTQRTSKQLFVEVLNCFDQKRRTFTARTYNPVLNKFCVTQESLISLFIENKLEINISELRGPKEAKIALDHDGIALEKIVLLEDLDSQTLLVCSQSQAILVDRKKSKILDKIFYKFFIGKHRFNQFSAFQNQNLLISGKTLSLTVLKWNQLEGQPNPESALPGSRAITHLFDFNFFSQLSPLFGGIGLIYDVRFLEFEPKIFSILLIFFDYLSEDRHQYRNRLFHGLFDLRKRKFVNYNVVEKNSSNSFNNVDCAGNVFQRSRNGLEYSQFYKINLPKNLEELNQLLDDQPQKGSGGGVRTQQGCLRTLESPFELKFRIFQGEKGRMEKRFYYLLETQKNLMKRIIKYKLKDHLFEGENSAKEVRERDVDFIKAHECQHPTDKVWFTTGSRRRLRILIGSASIQRVCAIVPSTAFIILDEDLRILFHVKIRHDLDVHIDLNQKLSYSWMGEDRLYVSGKIVSGQPEQGNCYRSLVLDAKNKKIFRICLKDAGETVTDQWTLLHWVCGDNLLISHPRKISECYGRAPTDFSTLSLSSNL